MNFKINKAKSEDVLFFYKLRTSKIVKINSLNNDQFKFKEHQKWFFEN